MNFYFRNICCGVLLILLASCAQLKPIQPQQSAKVDINSNFCFIAANTYQKNKSLDLSKLYALIMLNFESASDKDALENLIKEDQRTAVHEYADKAIRNIDEEKLHGLYNNLEGCTGPHSPFKSGAEFVYADEYNAIEDLKSNIWKKYAPEDKKLFLSRTQGRKLCNIDIGSFLIYPQLKPITSCLYVTQGNLTAFQVTNEGILIHSDYTASDQFNGGTIFLHKTSRENIVDGGRIEPGIFAYTGIINYYTLFGGKSVYSFKRYTNANIMKGIYFYDGR